MLRSTEHVPGAGREGEQEDELPVVRRMEEKLREGVPVLVFPEGTRSLATRLRRFRRGGIEAAVRAGAPILPLFIGNDQPFLMKGVPFYRVPERTCDFVFEWLEPIETAGRDSREITRELAARYEARFAKLVEDRG
jgi:1-acyl-sn-glycerol-3-phosphate acyltransferase